MSLKKYLILFACLLLLGGCGAAKSTNDSVANTGAVISQAQKIDINVFLQSYMDAFNRHDMDALMAHYATGAEVLVFASDESYVLGKEELHSAFEMKREGWVNNNMSLVSSTIVKADMVNSLLQAKIIFNVTSTSWNGEYRTSFTLQEKDGDYLILKENM